jgi:hypothetical protein
MNGLKNASPANAILEGSLTLCCIYLAPSPHFRSRVRLGTPPWGVTRCRCRGGVGAQSLTLAKHHSLRYPGLGVCFGRCDRRMCNESNQTLRNKACAYYGMYWPQYSKRNMPDALESGRVEILGQNPRNMMITIQRTSQSFYLAKYSTTGQTRIASSYLNIFGPRQGQKPSFSSSIR